jgi:hypothetical protein
MIPVGVHAQKVERTQCPLAVQLPARRWNNAQLLAQLTLLLQRFSLAIVLVLGSMQRVAPAISVIGSTTVLAAARATCSSGAEFHRSAPHAERQLQAVDKRVTFEPEPCDCENVEDDAPERASFVSAACVTRYGADQVFRSTDVTHTAQRLVESARPRGPPLA